MQRVNDSAHDDASGSGDVSDAVLIVNDEEMGKRDEAFRKTLQPSGDYHQERDRLDRGSRLFFTLYFCSTHFYDFRF